MDLSEGACSTGQASSMLEADAGLPPHMEAESDLVKSDSPTIAPITEQHTAAGAGATDRQTVFEVCITSRDFAQQPFEGAQALLQVCITNAGKWMKKREMQKILDQAGVQNVCKVVKDTHALAGFIWFTSLEDREAAIPKLQELPTKGAKWKARSNAPREEVVHQPEEFYSGQKRARAVSSGTNWGSLTAEEQAQKLSDAVAPWHAVSYAQQLEQKQSSMRKVMRDVTSRLRTHILRYEDISKATRNDLVAPAKVDGSTEALATDFFEPKWSEHLDKDELSAITGKIFPEWLQTVPRATGFQVCPVHPIIASPVIDGYRNKIELTFGTSPDGKKCVGNRLGSYSESVHVMPIDTLRHVTNEMKLLAAALSAFALTSSLDVYDIDVHEGVWRNVTFRQSTLGGIMVFLLASPPKDPSQSSLYASELERFVGACLGTTGHVDSILVQEYDGLSAPPPNHPFRLLHGSSTLDDMLCGRKFEISAGAFFQVNPAAANQLFGVVRSLASTGALQGIGGAGSTAALLDVCCGTGAIGIICSADFARVVGVELSEPAVEDARRNAAANGLTNVTFVAAKAEEVMKNILEICAAPLEGAVTPVAVTEVVAVVDPPRGGLHPSIIRALRTSRLIHRLVYVSCNPAGSFLEDAVKLCCPSEKNSKFAAGPPFRPVLAVPVDMFPDTPHCELVTLFERKA